MQVGSTGIEDFLGKTFRKHGVVVGRGGGEKLTRKESREERDR